MISRNCVVVVFFLMVLINHSVNGLFKNTPNFQVTNKPFKFGYDKCVFLNMSITFKMPPVNAGYVVLRHSPTDDVKRNFEIIRPNGETGDPVANIQGFMLSEHIYIDVKLFNKSGIVLNKRISEGTAVNSNDLDSTYSPICLNGETCVVEVDLRTETEDSLNCLNVEMCEVKADLREQTENAEIKKTKIRNNFSLNNYTITILCLSVFATTMFVLATVSFTKSYWSKCDTPEKPQIPLQKWNPFYANLLFRKECQEIIDDLEQNHYELLDPFERR